MADYSYTNRRFMPQGTNNHGTRFEPWGARNNGVEPHSNGWGKTGFSTPNETPRDHVCKPVIIDAEGRKRPLVAYSPNNMDNCVTKTETIDERIYAPEVNSYGNVSPTKIGDRKGYGGLDHGWNRPRSPTYERPPVVVEEIISHVQTEPSRPSKTSLVSSMLWRKKPHSHGHDGGTHGYSSDGHHGNSGQPQHFDAYKEEPTVITDGGWVRPSRAGWAAPSTPITKPTNDIGTAIDYLKDTAMSHSVTTAPTQRRFMVPPPMVPRVETYDSPTMDSRDSLRRYGPPHPATSADVYSSGAIDSREALRKYHGQMM